MIEERELRALMEGFPIDYDNELIQGVIQWIKECFDEPTTRTKTLVIVGETRIGKTHLMTSKLVNPALKLIEYQKNDFDFKTYDPTKEILFRILDDPTFNTQGVNVIKPLMSANLFKVNVKYDNKLIVPTPLILLFNKEKFIEFIKAFDETAWFLANSFIIPDTIPQVISRTIQPNPKGPVRQSFIHALDDAKVDSFNTKLYFPEEPIVEYKENEYLLYKAYGITSAMIKSAFSEEGNDPIWLKLKTWVKK